MPPSCPKSGLGSVKKCRLSWLKPLKTTVPSTSARIDTAKPAEPTARMAIVFCVRRRRRSPFDAAVMSYGSTGGTTLLMRPSGPGRSA